MHTHRSVAVEGVGFGHRVLATLGFWGIQVSIETRPVAYGGGAPVDVYYIVFNIDFYGKKIRKSYALTALDIAIRFISRLLEVPTIIKAKFIEMRTIERNVKIDSMKEINKVINVKVDNSELKVSVKRK